MLLGAVAKEAAVRSIEAVAGLLGFEITDQGGCRLWGGHSLRVKGARWLARQGVSLPVIQLLARCSSDVVLRYVAEVPLANLAQEKTSKPPKPKGLVGLLMMWVA